MIRLSDIEAAVCAEFGVSSAHLRGVRRFRHLALPRIAFYGLAGAKTNRSLPEIARHIRRRDHTTVLHGQRRFAELMASDAEFADAVRRIKKALDGLSRRRITRSFQSGIANIDGAPKITGADECRF
jgi:chromosomal replication initiator protein